MHLHIYKYVYVYTPGPGLSEMKHCHVFCSSMRYCVVSSLTALKPFLISNK